MRLGQFCLEVFSGKNSTTIGESSVSGFNPYALPLVVIRGAYHHSLVL